jgi:hypothetical protein
MSTIKCDACGKFISYKDIEDKIAIHRIYHEWDYFQEDTRENNESTCKNCIKKEKVA